MKKKERRPEDLAGGQWLNTMCEVLKGGALAGLTAILMLLVCSALVSAGILPVGGMYGAVLAVCVLGALVGGVCAVRKVKGRSLLVGLGVGAVLFLLLLTAGLIVYGSTDLSNGGAGILCACLCGGAIPGLLARKPKKKRRR